MVPSWVRAAWRALIFQCAPGDVKKKKLLDVHMMSMPGEQLDDMQLRKVDAWMYLKGTLHLMTGLL